MTALRVESVAKPTTQTHDQAAAAPPAGPGGQVGHETQFKFAPGLAEESSHTPTETYAVGARSSAGPVEVQSNRETHMGRDLTGLRASAEQFADTMKFRMASANRLRQGGLDAEQIEQQLELLVAYEKVQRKALLKSYRQLVPAEIWAWQKTTLGLGEHSFARLLGHLGHPVLATPYHWSGSGKNNRKLIADPPYRRGVGQLWSYCGLGDATRKRRRGMSVEDALSAGSPVLRSVMLLIAEGCVYCRRSPYRPVYDAAKTMYATREGWTPGHQDAAAKRKVAKAILKDLWLVAQ